MPWIFWPDSPVLSLVAWFTFTLVLLYAARHPVHAVIRAATGVVVRALRVGAHAFAIIAREFEKRSPDRFQAHARQGRARSLEREFDRAAARVRRDLHGYPELQQHLLKQIASLEDDYKKCSEVPPPPPEWVKAVELMARLKHTDDGLLHQILTDISVSVDGVYDRVMHEYRRSYTRRHRALARLLPTWRSLGSVLERMQRDLGEFEAAAMRIDAHAEHYGNTLTREWRERGLYSPAIMQFALASGILIAAVGAAFVYYTLLVQPLTSAFGAGSEMIGALATFVVVALCVVMGLCISEALRMTRLIARIGELNARHRHLFALTAGAMLGLLTIVGVTATLSTVSVGGDETAYLPPVVRVAVSFILPFALALIPIPLELLARAVPAVMGAVVGAVMRVFGVGLRLFGTGIRSLGELLINVYDIAIFLPLWIERMATPRSRPPGLTSVSSAKDDGQIKPSKYRRVG